MINDQIVVLASKVIVQISAKTIKYALKTTVLARVFIFVYRLPANSKIGTPTILPIITAPRIASSPPPKMNPSRQNTPCKIQKTSLNAKPIAPNAILKINPAKQIANIIPINVHIIANSPLYEDSIAVQHKKRT